MMFPFSFQKGNKTAGCEDAPPVSNIRFSVVCDGLGGAGSTKHKVEEAGTVVMRTSGYLGSSCLLYTSPSPRDRTRSRMPSSA